MRRIIVAVALALVATALIACTPRQIVVPVTTIEVEVTREVEIEVTRELEVTREVPVTREIETIIQVEPSAVVPSPTTNYVEIEVTREVPVTRRVEVTREIPVTRQVEVTREVEAVREVEVVRQSDPIRIEIPVTWEVEVTREVPVLPDDVVDLCSDFPYMLILAQRHLEYLDLFKSRRDAPGVEIEDRETIFYNLGVAETRVGRIRANQRQICESAADTPIRNVYEMRTDMGWIICKAVSDEIKAYRDLEKGLNRRDYIIADFRREIQKMEDARNDYC